MLKHVKVIGRTREIGLRKVLGTLHTTIRFQFIVESVILCTIGGIALLSSISAVAILISAAFSMSIDIFFGYSHINIAAHLDPIDALRYA
jgi:putative ABC transport system permease protein